MTEKEITTLYQIISLRIREARKKKGLKQQELAALVGKDRASVANIETGRQRPPLHVLWTIAEKLDMLPAELIPTREEVSMAATTPALSAEAIAKIEAVADGDPTVRLRLARFLEEETLPRQTDNK